MLITPSTASVGSRVYNESPSGLVNGSNTVFLSASKLDPGTEAVYFNGVRQLEGAGNDYVLSESIVGFGFDTITFAVAPRSRPGSKPDDSILIDYNLA